MRTTALTFVIVTTAASFVSAAPAREETTGRISYNEHRKPVKIALDRQPGWVELASPTPASHGREFILVGANAGALTQLRLTAASGHPEIHLVRVEYEDGSHRVFEVGRVLDGRHRPAYLDLRGAREVRQIIVTSDRRSLGSYLLEGNTTENVAAR